MDAKDYEKIYIEFGIQFEPLPDNYNPDEYGKKLMSSYQLNEGVVYSASTSLNQSLFKDTLA